MAKQKPKVSRRERSGRQGTDDSVGTTVPMRQKSASLRAKEAWNRNETKPLAVRNEAQAHYLEAMRTKQVVVGEGPAGTGKTYVSVKYAAQLLDQGQVECIVVVRPIIESGGGLGFLPGDMAEKTAPYQVPFLEVLEEHYGREHLEAKMNCRYPVITFVAPEFIRGRTFKNAFVILDEAQNMDCGQMKTFLTRLGEDTRCVLQGDTEQVDITGRSGLLDAIEILEGMQEAAVVRFVEEDIVRSGFCKAVLLRYRHRKMFGEAPPATATPKKSAVAKTTRTTKTKEK